MPITDVRTYRITAPLHAPFKTSLRTTDLIESLVVEVVDDDDRRGYGEVPEVGPITGEFVAGAEAVVQTVLRDLLVGRDPDDYLTILREVDDAVWHNAGAKAGVDVALHDLAARRLGVPLARMLGGGRLRVPTDVTLSAGEAADLAAAARGRVAEGFSVLKVKVGVDPAGDAARVTAIREAVGPDAVIRLDANQGWTPRQAVRSLHALEDAGVGVELVEQPVPAWDIEGLAWVSDRVDIPVMADEAVFGVRDLVKVIHRRAADMVNVKLAKCGGIVTARTLLELARAHDMGTIVGSMMESQITVTASASLVAAHGTTAVSDLDAAWWLSDSPVQGGLRYEGGTVILPAEPGLGVTLPDEFPTT